jgi:hypothetical protein
MAPANLPESRDEPATNFHPWSCLPDELQLEVLGHLLSESEPVTHAKHEDHRHRQTGLFNVITTQNRDLVSRAIEACKPLSSYTPMFTDSQKTTRTTYSSSAKLILPLTMDTSFSA